MAPVASTPPGHWRTTDFRVIIAPSFADIFYNNCFKNGILPLVLSPEQVDTLFTELYANEGFSLQVDLLAQTVTTPSSEEFGFSVDEFRKQRLLEGLDDIGMTLKSADAIRRFESRWQQRSPWLFGDFENAAET